MSVTYSPGLQRWSVQHLDTRFNEVSAELFGSTLAEVFQMNISHECVMRILNAINTAGYTLQLIDVANTIALHIPGQINVRRVHEGYLHDAGADPQLYLTDLLARCDLNDVYDTLGTIICSYRTIRVTDIDVAAVMMHLLDAKLHFVNTQEPKRRDKADSILPNTEVYPIPGGLMCFDNESNEITVLHERVGHLIADTFNIAVNRDDVNTFMNTFEEILGDSITITPDSEIK